MPVQAAQPPDTQSDGCSLETCKGKLYRDAAANGTGRVRSWCMACNRPPNPRQPFIGKVTLAPGVFEGLPAWPGQEDAWRPCEVCGRVGPVELHHWAPRHLFKDADSWPTSHLCGPCHLRWHATVTPDMGALKAR